VLQDVRTLILAILVAILWNQWMQYHDDVRQQVSSWKPTTKSLEPMAMHARTVSVLFNRWQLISVIIVGAFLPWTVFYWINVMTFGDSRYVVAAFTIHLHWAITWILVSAPLIHTFYAWTNLKSEALALVASSTDDSKEVDRKLAYITQSNPLTNLQIIGAGVVSIFSFLLPIINLIIGR
jgi:hypothetical protein